MSVVFKCAQCGALRTVPDAMVGRKLRCPECDTLAEVIPAAPAIADSQELSLDDADGQGTVMLESIPPGDGQETVILEPVGAPPARTAAQGTVPQGTPRRPGTPRPQAAPAAAEAEEDEAPQKVKKSQLVETEMDMTPMVDATFQLLIFFMITAAFALQKSKEIPKPKSDEASTNVVQQQEEETANAVTVRIDQFNSFVVINADGDEEEAPSVVDLHQKLRRAHDGDSEGRVPTKLRVEAHDEALHDRVITAIDAGNDAGFAEVELSSIEDDS